MRITFQGFSTSVVWPIQGRVILCGGPSWALGGVQQHPDPTHPLSARSSLFPEVVIVTDVPRHRPVFPGGGAGSPWVTPNPGLRTPELEIGNCWLNLGGGNPEAITALQQFG